MFLKNVFYTHSLLILYGFYATFLKVKVPPEKEETFKFTVFLGFVGLINDFLLLPLFPLFNWIGLEIFEWPSGHTLVLLTVNAIIGTVLSDYCWARSVVLLGPLITSLGITLTFPLSLFIDLFAKKKNSQTTQTYQRHRNYRNAFTNQYKPYKCCKNDLCLFKGNSHSKISGLKY